MKKLLLMVAAIAVLSGSAFSQETVETNVQSANGQKANVPEAVQVLNMLGTLIQYGYEQEAALPLIQAIEIYQNYTSEGTRAGNKTSESNGVVAEVAAKQSKVNYDIEKLLADAANFADGDEHLLAIIEDLKNTATRGATRDYATHYDRVEANTTDTYTIRFRGGEEACVIVCGDGDTDLDLYVYDENGNLVDSDTDATDACVAVWNPKWTGPFTIKIKNLGNVYNRYSLTVN